MASRYRRDIIVASLYHENSNQEPSLYQENVSRKPYIQLAIGEEIEGQLYFLHAMLDSHTLSCGSTCFYRVIIPHDSAWESSVAWTKYRKRRRRSKQLSRFSSSYAIYWYSRRGSRVVARRKYYSITVRVDGFSQRTRPEKRMLLFSFNKGPSYFKLQLRSPIQKLTKIMSNNHAINLLATTSYVLLQ